MLSAFTSRARIVSALLVVLAIGGFIAYMRLRPLAVVGVPVVRGKAVDAVYATGTVEAEDRVPIKAKSSGSIGELVVREGSVVKRGDLLARIDNPAVSFDLKRGHVDLSAGLRGGRRQLASDGGAARPGRRDPGRARRRQATTPRAPSSSSDRTPSPRPSWIGRALASIS